MAYLDDLGTELKTVVATVVDLPPPGPNQINTFTVMQGMNRNFVTSINDQEIILPCIVVEIGTFVPELEFGMDNWAQNRIPVSIHYIAQLAGVNGTQGLVDEQARNIVTFIDNPANSFSFFSNAVESGEVMSDLSAAINEALFAVSRVNVISSCAKWMPGFLINFQLPV